MNAKLTATSLALSLLMTAGAALAEGDVAAGQAKSSTCVACHGVDGNSVNPEWPSIAGQHASYIVNQLKAFKSGTRQNALMAPMAMTLSDQDMADLAAYFSSQSMRGKEADKDKVAAGEKLYRGGNPSSSTAACIACHGPGGRGNPGAGYPAIQGQHSTYVVAQLNAYKSKSRTTDDAVNRMMQDVASQLTAEEVAAVAAYVQGLR